MSYVDNMTELEKVADDIEQKASEFDKLKVNMDVAPEFFENEIHIQFTKSPNERFGQGAATSYGIDEIVREFDLEYFPASDGFAGAGFGPGLNDGEIEIHFKYIEEEGE